MCRDGIPLTADALCSLYHGLNEKYFGPDMCVDPEIDVEWARIPHFYYTFYVYQYATAFAAAVTIGQRIFDGDKNALEGYFNFLKGRILHEAHRAFKALRPRYGGGREW